MILCIRNDKFWEYMPSFVLKHIKLKTLGIEILGYFPYHTARITSEHGDYTMLPRDFFKSFEAYLYQHHIQDNKAVYICKPLKGFLGDPFAILLKDSYALIGGWNSVTDYNCKPLHENKELNLK